MDKALSSLSRFMMIVTPELQKLDQFRPLVPGATLIDSNGLQESQVAETIAHEVREKRVRILLIVNRPPLQPAQLVEYVRATQDGRELYVVVVCPPDVNADIDIRVDIDDIVYLQGQDDFSKAVPVTVARYLRTLELRKNFINATKTALNAMDSAAEYGSLIHFFDASETCTSMDALCDTIYEFLSNKGLEVFFCIDTGREQHYRPSTHRSAARFALLAELKAAGKHIVSAERLLGYHFNHLTLLISNGPVEQAEKYGQLKDAVAHFCAIAEARIKNILIQQRTLRQHQQVLDIMHLIRQSTDESTTRTKTIMTRLLKEVERAATTFDMHFKEEQKLLEIVGQASESLEQLRENDELIEAHFLELIAAITSVMELARVESGHGKPQDTVELF